MDPMLSARMRRIAPLLAATILTALFVLVHSLVFAPAAVRYASVLKHSGSVGTAFDPATAPPSTPPRVYSLLLENSLPADEADSRGASGTLGAELVQHLSDLAARRGLEVQVAEPGPISQTKLAVQPRSHLRLRGTYAAFVGLLDDLTRGGRLVTLERFTLAPLGAGQYDIELYAVGNVLRRTAAGAP